MNMASQNAFLFQLCVFVSFNFTKHFKHLLSLSSCAYISGTCLSVCVCVVVLLLFECLDSVFVCVVHGCVCELTLRLASSSHFSYSQHLLVILRTLHIVLGLWSPFLSFL